MSRLVSNHVENCVLKEARLLSVEPEPGSSFSFRHLRTRRFPFPFHYHPEIELTYIVKGRGRRIVGEIVRPFQAGDLVLLGSMLPHVWLSDSQCPATEAYVLRFDGALLDKHLCSFPECSRALAWIRRAAKGLELSESSPAGLIDLFKILQRAATPTKRLPCFLDLILSLADASGWKTICGDFQGLIVHASTEQRIGFALRYLHEHFCEEVAQVEVARRVGMSAPAFSRLFQRVTGQTFQELLLGLRVDHACRLLSATSFSIAEVCFASGFRNLSNFNKQFLNSKCLSPRAYRKLQPIAPT